jgi:hypothetical protein
VLVTGFHDWEDLGDPPNVWRCRDNPSCRLLVGAESRERPTAFEGPLVERLERAAPGVEWTFSTLPVVWGAFRDVPQEHDVVVNLGLGVYDRFDALQLERGAYNLRRGLDAAGSGAPGPIDPSAAAVREPPAAMTARIDRLVGRRLAGFEVLGAEARSSNSYLCNETHWNALAALDEDRPREAYFVHIPHAEGDDYAPLAEAVATLVLALVER